ncbi:sterol desaturase family protein [Crocinitomicaceae bacterium]|nr:sterol desaturase family protein [Crocinitomicaceae bacterium]
MTREWVALGTVLVLLASNLFGLIYSMVVLKTNIFKSFRIQTKNYDSTIFRKRMPLFIFNFLILLSVAGIGSFLIYESMDTTVVSIWIIASQIFFAFVIDDVWFYFFHRWLHENKFMLKNVHAIHHRATTPFPLEYLYAHPLEWMLGMIGVVIAFALILLVMPINIYALWGFGLLRNLHEIHIHSDLELPLLSKLPFLSKTKHHDDHHSKLSGNYASTFNWMDKIFNSTFKE